MLNLQEESSEGTETSNGSASNVGDSGTSVGSWLAVCGRWSRASASWVCLGWVSWCSWCGGVLANWWVVRSWRRWLDWAVWNRASLDLGGLVNWNLGGVGCWDGEGGGRGDHVGLRLVSESGSLWAVGGVDSLVGLDSGWLVDWGR